MSNKIKTESQLEATGRRLFSAISKRLAMAQDPVIVAAKKAYRESRTFQIDKLIEERSRWSRKQTIASNKLDEVNKQIALLCEELAKEIDGKGKETK